MTETELTAIVFATGLILAVLICGFWLACFKLGQIRAAKRVPKTGDMLDEFARLAIARESRERATTDTTRYAVCSAEAQIREFLKRPPASQLRELTDARKDEYVHTTAAEMMMKHDPVRSAAHIAKLEADVYPQPKTITALIRHALKG